jgi:hypothetical protein
MAKDSAEKLSPAAEAYVWGFPLVSVHRTRLHLCSRTDSGTMNHVDDLATPDDRAIVAPNNDTLYSSAWYDLTYGDLTIEVPPMDHAKRYWNVMVVDAYTHVSYICRRDHGVGGTRVRVTLDPGAGPDNSDSHVVRIGTPTAWVIIRVLVESQEDIDAARKLQRSISVIAPESHPHVRTERAGRATEIGSTGADIFAEIKRYTKLDPPASRHPQLSAQAQAIIDDPTSVPVSQLEAGVAAGEKLIRGGNAANTVVKNGWSTGRESDGPGNDILKRAIGAKFGLGGHYAIENRSYIAAGGLPGRSLDGNHPLELKFEADAMPPCNAFWSLTAYGTDLYLVENEIDRWSISDRTPGLVYDDNGGLTLQLSAARPAEINNWLPVPSGPYLLGMRVYEGQPDVINCHWFPPALTGLR